MTKSNRNHIFIDTNIIIGAYLNDKKYENEKRCWDYLTSLVGKKVFVSSLSIAQFVSTFQHRKTNKKLIKHHVQNIIAKVNIIDFTKDDIDKSLLMNEDDMEDNIQYVLAYKLKCGIFFTQNTKDYNSYISIAVYSAKEHRTIEQY